MDFGEIGNLFGGSSYRGSGWSTPIGTGNNLAGADSVIIGDVVNAQVRSSRISHKDIFLWGNSKWGNSSSVVGK